MTGRINKIGKYKCPYCKKKFRTKAAYREHLKRLEKFSRILEQLGK